MSEEARAYRAHSRSRAAGYRLFPGEGFSYVLHMRPREWPIMAAHTALGFILARGVHSTLRGTGLGALWGALGIWVLLLNGGTLAINSAFDRDVGDVGYLDAPPPAPRALAPFALALMTAGQLLAFALPRGFAVAYAICFVLSLMYSVPPVRLKAVAGADWLINMVGFGSLTPYAGWAATGRPLTDSAAWVLVAFCPLFAALFPLTQLYQLEEDRTRGDRTLAVAIGVRRSLILSLVFASIAFACFARAAQLSATTTAGRVTLGVASLSWLAVLASWLARSPRMAAADHKRGMYLALGAWAVTDIAALTAFAA